MNSKKAVDPLRRDRSRAIVQVNSDSHAADLPGFTVSQAQRHERVTNTINAVNYLGDELIKLCGITGSKVLTVKQTKLRQITRRYHIIIPLQESLTANLPPLSVSQNKHKPFPSRLPIFHGESSLRA